MTFFSRSQRTRPREKGQTLLMFVFFMVVLIVFIGLGIDLGFAYITKAELSKGVDAAALAGMLNFSQGTVTAENIAKDTFAANYRQSGRDVNAITPSITWSNDASNGNNFIDVSATTQINTFFIRVMPAIGGADFSKLQVSSSAQATRSRVDIELVLDRSGSMNPTTGTTQGGKNLPGAVTQFLSYFSETLDKIGMDSFASTVTNDFSIATPFKTPISTAASNLIYAGGTFSVGGLTNALVQLNAVAVPAGQNVIKVAVFFTDGKANMIQQLLGCGQVLNFGGFDTSRSGAAFYPTNTPVTESAQNCYPCSAPENGTIGTTGCTGGCGGCDVNSYVSPQTGGAVGFTTDGITSDSEFECEQIANQMRAQGIYVFCAGLNADPNNPVNFQFLQQVANDPGPPANPAFDSNLPVGKALIANDPTQLDAVFKQIAEEILLRLTR